MPQLFLRWDGPKYYNRFGRITAYIQEKRAMGLLDGICSQPPRREFALGEKEEIVAVCGYHSFVTPAQTYRNILCPGLAALYCSYGFFPALMAFSGNDDTFVRDLYRIQIFVPHYIGKTTETTNQYGPISMDDVDAVTAHLRKGVGAIWRREGSG